MQYVRIPRDVPRRRGSQYEPATSYRRLVSFFIFSSVIDPRERDPSGKHQHKRTPAVKKQKKMSSRLKV